MILLLIFLIGISYVFVFSYGMKTGLRSGAESDYQGAALSLKRLVNIRKNYAGQLPQRALQEIDQEIEIRTLELKTTKSLIDELNKQDLSIFSILEIYYMLPTSQIINYDDLVLFIQRSQQK
ncbi:MAG: hypothetical protein IM323_15500 [Microcystis sp. M049S1]|nr:hypothetical protein [Microcystis sp. M049S1]